MIPEDVVPVVVVDATPLVCVTVVEGALLVVASEDEGGEVWVTVGVASLVVDSLVPKSEVESAFK